MLHNPWEVIKVRAASWATMIKQRNDSRRTIKEWCAANGNQESVYYYRLSRLRKMAFDVCETPNPNKNNAPIPGTFAQIPVPSAVLAPNVAIRLRHGDTVGCKQRCTGLHPLFLERGAAPCCLKSSAFRPSMSTVANVISSKGLMA